jgi:hypothetical protein
MKCHRYIRKRGQSPCQWHRSQGLGWQKIAFLAGESFIRDLHQPVARGETVGWGEEEASVERERLNSERKENTAQLDCAQHFPLGNAWVWKYLGYEGVFLEFWNTYIYTMSYLGEWDSSLNTKYIRLYAPRLHSWKVIICNIFSMSAFWLRPITWG